MWEIAEHWTGATAHAIPVEIWLMKPVGIFMEAWRIEWSVNGATRKGESYATEAIARDELARVKASVGLDWQLAGS